MNMKISRSEKIGADYCNNFFAPFLLYSYFSSLFGILSIYRLTSLGKEMERNPDKKAATIPNEPYLINFNGFFLLFICVCKKLQQKTGQIATIPSEPLKAFSVKTGVESAPQYKALC